MVVSVINLNKLMDFSGTPLTHYGSLTTSGHAARGGLKAQVHIVHTTFCTNIHSSAQSKKKAYKN